MRIRQLGQNTIIYAIGNIGLRVSSFLMIPLYTHFLSMHDYGLLATLLLTIQALISIMEFGATTAIMRFAGEYDAGNDMAGLLGSSILVTFFSCGIVSLLTISFAEAIFKGILQTENARFYISLTCGAAAGQTLFMKILSYYRAQGQGIKFTAASISAAVLLLAVNWYFLVILNQGINGVLLAQIVTYGCAWLGFTIYIACTSSIQLSLKTAKKLAIFGFPLVFASVGHLAADTSAVYFLGFFKSLEEVAIFSLGFKIASVTGIILILPFELAYEPFVYSNKDRPGIQHTISRLLTYLMLAFAFAALGVIFIFRPLFPLVAPLEYGPAYKIMISMFIGFAFLGFRGVGQSLLHIRNKTSVTGTTITIYTAATVILQYLLIPKMGMYALVLTFNLMNIAIGVTLMVLGIREFPVKIEKTRMIIIAFLYSAFIFAGFILWDQPGILFYSVIPAAAVFSLCSLYHFGFFDEEEKQTIRFAIDTVAAYVKKRQIINN